MKKQSKKTAKSASCKQHFCPHDEYQLLRFGMNDRIVADILRVSVATARRWRLGLTRVPWMASELLRQRQGTVLPGAYKDFAGFEVIPGDNGAGLIVPPGAHWRAGINAYSIRAWPLLRQFISLPASAIDKATSPSSLP